MYLKSFLISLLQIHVYFCFSQFSCGFRPFRVMCIGLYPLNNMCTYCAFVPIVSTIYYYYDPTFLIFYLQNNVGNTFYGLSYTS